MRRLLRRWLCDGDSWNWAYDCEIESRDSPCSTLEHRVRTCAREATCSPRYNVGSVVRDAPKNFEYHGMITRNVWIQRTLMIVRCIVEYDVRLWIYTRGR